MISFEVIISHCCDHGHGLLEGIDECFKFVSDRIGRQILLNSVANLGKLICPCLDIFRINVAELLLNPGVCLLLPFKE